MESAKDLLQLLVRFSNSIWILKYFGNFQEWEKVMKQLCTQTLESWNENKEMYLSIQPLERKWLKIRKYFDEEISNFLLKNELYAKYKLNIYLSYYSNSLADFAKFLELVPYPKQLIFKSIVIKSALDENYLKIYKFIQDNWNQDPRLVFRELPQLYLSKLQIKQESFLYHSNYLK